MIQARQKIAVAASQNMAVDVIVEETYDTTSRTIYVQLALKNAKHIAVLMNEVDIVAQKFLRQITTLKFCIYTDR